MKYLLCVLTLLTTGWAMPISQFSRMADEDQTRYIAILVEHTKAASQTDPELHSSIVNFFRLDDPGHHRISGMGQFELNMAYARIADLQAAEKNPKVHRIEVEDVFYVTLTMNGIYLREHWRQPFTPRGSMRAPVTMAEAKQFLANTQKWVYKSVKPEPFTTAGLSPNYNADRTTGTIATAMADAYKKQHPNAEEKEDRCDAECLRWRQQQIEQHRKAFMSALQRCESNNNCS